MESRRVMRVEREIRHIMAELLIHGLKIPLPGFTSVVDVKASPDLRSARVFIRVAGGKKNLSEAESLLESQHHSIQKHVASELDLKFSPHLKFVLGGAQTPELDEVDLMLANLHRPKL